MSVDEARCRAAFTPGVFATDVALRKVAEGTPWRDAYHDVRDHLERLSGEDPDRAVAAKTHEGATGGLDTRIYLRRARESLKGVGERLAALNKAKAALLK